MKKFLFIISALGVLFQPSCTKDEEEDKPTAVTVPIFTVNMSHVVSGEPMVFNERIYKNAANNPYEVRHLEYYISDFKLMDQQGQWISIQSEPKLINPQDTTKSAKTELMNVPVGTYQGISCMIGIPEEENYTGSLPNTIENMNMAWPDPIGGGYHFLKFEGNYQDDKMEWNGYVLHLGNNGFQSPNTITDVSITVSSSNTSMGLTMDMNEWYDNPNFYDFNVQGYYTMAIDSLMEIVSENGRNCLSVK